MAYRCEESVRRPESVAPNVVVCRGVPARVCPRREGAAAEADRVQALASPQLDGWTRMAVPSEWVPDRPYRLCCRWRTRCTARCCRGEDGVPRSKPALPIAAAQRLDLLVRARQLQGGALRGNRCIVRLRPGRQAAPLHNYVSSVKAAEQSDLVGVSRRIVQALALPGLCHEPR